MAIFCLLTFKGLTLFIEILIFPLYEKFIHVAVFFFFTDSIILIKDNVYIFAI